MGKFLTLFFLFLSSQSFAQTARIVQSELDLELKITNHITKMLSTRLPAEMFSVGVKVTLLEQQPAKVTTPVPSGSTSIPEAVLQNQLSTINTEKLVQSYKTEIENLKSKAGFSFEDRLIIQRVNIQVGIDDKYEDSYVAEIDAWLKKYAAGLYGSKAVTSVTKIQQKPSSFTDNKTSWKDLLQQFQGLLGWIFLSLALIIAAAMMGLRSRGGGSPDLSAQASPALGNGPQPANTNQTNQIESKSLTSQVTSFQEMDFISRTTGHLSGKIFLASLEMPNELVNFVRYQLSEEPDGDFKIACLIDALYSTREKMLLKMTEDIAHMKNSWVAHFSFDGAFVGFEKKIKARLKELSEMSYEKRINLYESVYWDLIAFKTLGKKQYNLRLEQMQTLKDSEKQKILEKISLKDKIIALLIMKPEQRKAIFSSLDEATKLEVFKQLKSADEILENEIQKTETSVRHYINSNLTKLGTDDTKVDLSVSAVELINSLKPSEAIRLHKECFPDFDQQPEFLKNRWTLAYLHLWPQKVFPLIHQACDMNEVKLMCLVDFDFKEMLIKSASTRNATILKDELETFKELHRFTEAEEDQLAFASKKIFELLEMQNFKANEIVGTANTFEGRKAS